MREDVQLRIPCVNPIDFLEPFTRLRQDALREERGAVEDALCEALLTWERGTKMVQN